MYFQTAIVRKTGHKCQISVVSFHHELLSYAFKVFLSEIFWLHRDIQIFSSFHEHQQCLFKLLFTEKFGHKYHT